MKSVVEELAALRRLDTLQLVERYIELYEREPRSRNRESLYRKCAWKVQERALGGLSGAAKTKLDSLIAGLAPFGAPPVAPEKNGLRPGTEIVRTWRDRTLRLVVRDNGYEVDGALHESLSAAAFAVTGAKWNGRVFWGLKERAR